MSKIDKTAILNDLRNTYGDSVTRAQIFEFEQQRGMNHRSVISIVRVSCPRVGRGAYALTADASAAVPVVPVARVSRVPKAKPAVAAMPVAMPVPAAISENTHASLSFAVSADSSSSDITATIHRLASDASLLASVPAVSKAFVPFGDYDTIRTVIASRVFCPFFITGHSGNGKTFSVQQACAAEKREFVRVNITVETDEDDLIGGFRLKNGETVFELGPIVVAMLRGAVLLLDEVDLAGSKIMCLQPVLEGQPLLIKKLGVTIHPATGFTIFATANTKGRGSEDGKYIGTNMLNEAFLERFNATIEQQYPAVNVEKKILASTYLSLGGVTSADSTTFFETLSKWADAIRATFHEGGIEDIITTRRLCHVVKLYRVFGNQQRALTLALNRFDTDVQQKFLDFYAKLDPTNADTTQFPDATTAAPTAAATV